MGTEAASSRRGNPHLDSPVLAGEGHRPLLRHKRNLTLSSSYQPKRRVLKTPCFRDPLSIKLRDSGSGIPIPRATPPYTSGSTSPPFHLRAPPHPKVHPSASQGTPHLRKHPTPQGAALCTSGHPTPQGGPRCTSGHPHTSRSTPSFISGHPTPQKRPLCTSGHLHT